MDVRLPEIRVAFLIRMKLRLACYSPRFAASDPRGRWIVKATFAIFLVEAQVPGARGSRVQGTEIGDLTVVC
jgi:hypothetical protein